MAKETSKISETVSKLIEKAETTLTVINDTNIRTQESLRNAKIEKKKEERMKAAMKGRLQEQKEALAQQR